MPVRPVVQPIVSSDGKVAFQDHEIATEFCKAYGKNSVHVSDYIKSVEVNQLKSSLTSDIGNSSNTLLLNKDITIKEVNDSIKHLKDSICTSPEEDIPSLFIKRGGTEFQTYLMKLFNMCLNEGKLPKAFLLDHKIVISKPFKELQFMQILPPSNIRKLNWKGIHMYHI